MNHYIISETPITQPSNKRLNFFILSCLLIYFLNCTDLLFTYTYLKIGYFREFNPLMQSIVYLPIASILIKIVMPVILFTPLFIHLRKTPPHVLMLGTILSSFIVLFYAIINCMHLYYLCAYIIFR